MKTVGIRKEDKNVWEKRVPLIPVHVQSLIQKKGIRFLVEKFEERAFSDDKYREAGAEVSDNIDQAEVIIGVKEIPFDNIHPSKVYMFFSHTIKGQDYNMPLLKKIIETNSTLIDYECIKNEKGGRLVFFGKYAGYAGMIDTFHTMGKRYAARGVDNPFEKILPAYKYKDINHAKEEISKVAGEIAEKGLPEELTSVIIGVTGYGNVSSGAQEILDLMPFKEISPDELLNLNSGELKGIVKVVFREKDIVKPGDDTANFELNDYYNFPEKYKSKFENYLPKLDVLVNAIYWDERYPVLVRKDYLRNNKIKLSVVGDITCDINGSVEITHKSTESDNPVFIYNPHEDSYKDGYEGEGIAVMAVDNLPTEIPVDASIGFSEALHPFIDGIANADYTLPFEKCNLPPEIKRAVIVYKGELTPDFEYLKDYLS